MITYIFAALFTFVYIGLSSYVISLRRTSHVGIGDGGDYRLQVAIRIHSNFIEYTLLFLLLFFLSEDKGLDVTFLSLGGVVFLLGRSMHIYALLNKNLIARTIAMAITFTLLAIFALFLIF